MFILLNVKAEAMWSPVRFFPNSSWAEHLSDLITSQACVARLCKKGKILALSVFHSLLFLYSAACGMTEVVISDWKKKSSKREDTRYDFTSTPLVF